MVSFGVVRKRAFTLIELLVVIAIIAILAAILFPVLSQAKEAGLDAKSVLQTRQLGMAALMYATDYSESLPLTQIAGPTDDITWQDQVGPYTKSREIFLHPRRQTTQDSFHTKQHFAMPPSARFNGSSAPSSQGYYTWMDLVVTRGRTVRFEGLTGHANATPNGEDPYNAGRRTTPSWQVAGLGRPSELILVTEAANWDMWWSFGDGLQSFALRHCTRWTPTERSAYGTQVGYAGPTALSRTRNRRSGIASSCLVPDGRTTVAMADGSAKSLDYRSGVMAIEEGPGGTWVLKRFWPEGLGQ